MIKIKGHLQILESLIQEILIKRFLLRDSSNMLDRLVDVIFN